METQVAIVGAGPAGAATAIGLARRGVHDVVLLDQSEFPRVKTCGSGLSPNALALLDELGLGERVRREGYPVGALRLKTPGGRQLCLASEQVAVVYERSRFDQLLVEEAVRLGVTFRGGFRVRRLLQDQGRVVGVEGEGGSITARYVVCADGAHSMFSSDARPRTSMATLMGWWEGVPFAPGTLEMIFDRRLAPLYGWLFPESESRVNIGICVDGGERKPDLRRLFQEFLDEHFRNRLRVGRQMGKWRGHPISYTTWVGRPCAPGMLMTGEAMRLTDPATGEGISQAMRSGLHAADALADVLQGKTDEEVAWRRYTWRLRARFTPGFLLAHMVRAAVRTPLLDWVTLVHSHPAATRWATRVVGQSLTGSHIDARGKAPSPSVS